MSFFYVASPYAKYANGTEAAFQKVCRQTALLMKHGISVFSPIAHSHSVAMYGNINVRDHEYWMAVDRPFMDAAEGCIVCMMEGWEVSRGTSEEIETFKNAGKPIIYMTPGKVPDEFVNKSGYTPIEYNI